MLGFSPSIQRTVFEIFVFFVSLRFSSLSLFLSVTFLLLYRPEDLHRIRVEHMERQLANLTGLVQKALTQGTPTGGNVNQNYLGVPGQYRGKISNSHHLSHLDLLLAPPAFAHQFGRKEQVTENDTPIYLHWNLPLEIHHCLIVR